MIGRSKTRERQTAQALVTELGAQREAARELIARFEQESKVARNAVKAASLAREERDEYRRVLAAAIANERRQDAQVAELEARREELEARALDQARTTGAAEAERDGLRERLTSLERELDDRQRRHEKDLGDAADRAWSEREAARGEIVQLVTRTREEAADLAEEVRRALSALEARPVAVAAPPSDPGVSASRLRGRILIGLAVAAMLVGVALAPAAFFAAIDKEREAFIHLASGASTWQLIGATVICFALAVFLLGTARRDLRLVPSK